MPDYRTRVVNERGVPLNETEQGKLFAQLLDACPACKSAKKLGFFAGPRGAASQNIMCCDTDCRMEFNVAVLGPHQGFAEKSGQADVDRFMFFSRFPKWRGVL
jgi:hypothetical protein